MKEGDTGFQRTCLRNQCEIHHLLNRVGKQHGLARRSCGHDVAMIAEDREAVCGNCPSSCDTQKQTEQIGVHAASRSKGHKKAQKAHMN